MTLQNSYTIAENIIQTAAPFIPDGYEVKVSVVRKNTINKEMDELIAVEIQRLVCEYFNQTPELIMNKGRKDEIVFTRKIICFMIKAYTALTLTEIARYAGYNNDHTMTLSAVKSLQNWMIDPVIKEKVNNVNNFILRNTNI